MVYHILPEAEPFSEYSGGALSRWAANVLRDDDSCTIVCPWADKSWGFPAERVWSLQALRNYVWCLRILRSPRAMSLRVTWLKSAFRPLSDRLQRGDTVYIHNRPEFALALASTCRKKKARIVLHMQNSHLAGWFPASHRSLLDVDALVFCSAFLRREAVQYARRIGRTVVIPNGADETMFFPDPKGAGNESECPVVLLVGRLVPAKGIHIFAEALGILLKRGVRVSGRIIGSAGFGHNRSSEYIDGIKLNLPSNAQFVEYVSGHGLAEEFRKATIFCCPSVFAEPFGMVNVEAMATRLPVVATAVGGIPEIFEQGGAILVPPGSSPELADAIEFLINNPAKRHALAERGYATYKSCFRWQHIRSQYLDLIQEKITA